MPRNRIQWSEQEQMMAGAYANIASSFSQITAYMKNHLRTVQNGSGVITEGDMEEIFQQLSDMINKNLHNASQMRVKITTENVAPKKIATKNANSNWVSTVSNGSPVQFESKQPQKIRISESDLKRIISESVKSILNEYNSNHGNITPTEDERNFKNGYASIYEGIELLEKVNFENLIDIHGKTPREIRVKQSIGENEVYILKDGIREIKRIIQKWGHYINSILPLFRKPNGDGTYSWTE